MQDFKFSFNKKYLRFNFLNKIFYFSLILLSLISLYPGSILGFLFYGDLNIQPGGGPWTNHFFSYLIPYIISLVVVGKQEQGREFQKSVS